ncbi:MAG: hypothetical protein ABIF09_03510 [Gemmatimonadota bacterium]
MPKSEPSSQGNPSSPAARPWYYNEVFADPLDENTVYVLSVPMMKSVDGEEHTAEIGVLKDSRVVEDSLVQRETYYGQTALNAGWHPIRDQLSALLDQGIATFNEAVRAAGMPPVGKRGDPPL